MRAPSSVETMAPPRSAARGLAAFRIFIGLVWLANGLAKLTGRASFDLGFISFGLIDRNVARGLLAGYAGAESNAPPAMKSFYADVILANWGFFQWFLTAAELAIGIGLVLGIASRLAALGGLALIGPLWIMVLDNRRYFFEFPLDVIPLLILAIVPSGRVWGLDRRLAARLGDRWPF
jgi:uncharacterized membrane protein YphA (DoxX/SURF4 family)